MKRLVLALALLLAWPGPAGAAPLCLLNCSCSVAATPLTFGGYDPLDTGPADATTQVTVTCQITNLLGLIGLQVQLDYSLALNGGASGDAAARTMSGGGEQLGYRLYLDPARTQQWGDGTNGTTTITGSHVLLTTNPQPVSTTYTAYGRIPARQGVGAGSFVDVVTVTLTY